MATREELDMVSTESAGRFLSTYEPRIRALRAKSELAQTTTKIAKEWRAYLLTRISSYVSRHVGAILRDVLDDYGTVSRRRVERGLARLVADGKVVRTPDGYRRSR